MRVFRAQLAGACIASLVPFFSRPNCLTLLSVNSADTYWFGVLFTSFGNFLVRLLLDGCGGVMGCIASQGPSHKSMTIYTL